MIHVDVFARHASVDASPTTHALSWKRVDIYSSIRTYYYNSHSEKAYIRTSFPFGLIHIVCSMPLAMITTRHYLSSQHSFIIYSFSS